MCFAPTTTNSASTSSFTATMMLFARALSRTPSSSSQVINMTIANAGTLTRIGMPPMCGAECEQPWIVGSELSSAVRYPCVIQSGNRDPAAEQRLEVVAPRDRDRHVADRVLEDQIPADDPGDDLAQRRVRIRVRAAGLRNHRRQLGVAEPRQRAHRAEQHEREDERRAGADANDSPSANLSGGRRADRAEDPCADHGADRQHDQIAGAERSLQRPMLGFGNQIS